jgi:carboxyl-terminal processing protease
MGGVCCEAATSHRQSTSSSSQGLVWLLLVSIPLVSILFGAGTAAAQDPPDRPVMIAGRPAPALAGVWRSRGYGYVLQVGASGLELFHIAGRFCYRDPRPQRDPDHLFVLYRELESGAVAFSGLPGQTRYVFDRLAELPAACNDRAPYGAPHRANWPPPRIAALVAATFADIYPSFAERGIDWAARSNEMRPALDAVSDDAALFDALRTLLAGVEDAHVELHARIGGKERTLMPGEAPTLVRAGAREEEWHKSYRRGVLEVILKGRGHAGANGQAFWGRAGDIGYFNLLTFERFAADPRRPLDDPAALDAALDAAIAAFQGARAVIVDISNNDGGFDWLAQRVAGRFADRPRLAYTKVAIGAQGVEPQPFEVAPSGRARYLGPVYLLTSDITLSATEVFALYMRALPNVIHVGATTRGAFSDTINKPLPNGWTLVLPGEIYRDPQGQSYEVRGLPPQRRFEVFPSDDLFNGHARRVLVLMEEIRRELAAR